MKLKTLLIVIPFLSGCTVENPIGSDTTISVKGTVACMTETKSGKTVPDAYTETTASPDKPLDADIWFSTTAGKYQGSGGVKGETIDVHTTISYKGPSSTIPKPYTEDKYLVYPESGKDVYCVGFYPQAAWNVVKGSKSPYYQTATATIDGKKDLMFAPEISGNVNIPFNTKTQSFSHLLTWVKVRVRCATDEAGETWGKLEKVSISAAKTVSVRMTDGTSSFSTKNETLFSIFEGSLDLNTESEQIGSVLVGPPQKDDWGEKYYRINVKCVNHSRDDEEGTGGLSVYLLDNDGTLYEGDDFAGKVFVITLCFNSLDSVECTATLSDWEDESITLDLE